MDLDQAIAAHADWKVKLRMAIQNKETLDAAQVSADDRCMLGQWLHGEARAKFAGKAEYADCVAKHATFHAAAGAVARRINAGDYGAASDMLGPGSAYSTASFDVGASINRLKKAV
jgi:methyl-accepting chemotaxis protein